MATFFLSETPLLSSVQQASSLPALFLQQKDRGFFKKFTTVFQKSAWVSITPHQENNFVSKIRLQDWLLVLEAKSFPYRLLQKDNQTVLEVPESVYSHALFHIHEFDRETEERNNQPPIYIAPKRSFWPVVLLMGIVFFLYVLKNEWIVLPFPFPQADLWPRYFGLDAKHVIYEHEWWRAVTALFVHNTDSHLASNLVFGTIFLLLVSRKIGNGLGLLAVLSASFFANVCTAFFRQTLVISIGFSTAIFVSIGFLGIFSCLDYFFCRHKRRYSFFSLLRTLFAPLVASVILLGLLGGSSKNTDFTAHAWGLLSGVIIGPIFWKREKKLRQMNESQQGVYQLFLGLISLCIILLCWGLGLSQL